MSAIPQNINDPGISNAPVQYFGGKGSMKAKLLPMIPYNQLYVEPFCGGSSIFFARHPSPVEVLNDLDKDLINLFRFLQDPDKFERLQHRLTYTLYSRAEFAHAIEIIKSEDASEEDRAWAFFVGKNQGFSGIYINEGNWGRGFSIVASPVSRWLMRLSMLPDWHKRLACAQIDCVDAIKCIRFWDTEDTVFYLDPPYIHDTRKGNDEYNHEMANEQHKELIDTILHCKGAIVLSGYPHAIYNELDANGWNKTEFETTANSAAKTRISGIQGKGSALKLVPRTEVVWRNKRCMEMLYRDDLFSQLT